MSLCRIFVKQRVLPVRGCQDLSLRVGSPLCHAHERRRAKRYGGKESGEEATRKRLSRLAANDFALAVSWFNASLLAGYQDLDFADGLHLAFSFKQKIAD